MNTWEHGFSHVIGDTCTQLSEEVIPHLLAKTAALHPEREAVVFPAQSIRWSWSEFASEVDRLAAGLMRLEVEKGDRVGIWSPNRVEWLLTQFATARIGAVLVCINPAYRVYELEYALNKVGCKVLVTARKFKSSDYVSMIEILVPELSSATPGTLQAAKLPMLRTIITLGDEQPPRGMLTFKTALEKGAMCRLLSLTPVPTHWIETTQSTSSLPRVLPAAQRVRV